MSNPKKLASRFNFIPPFWQSTFLMRMKWRCDHRSSDCDLSNRKLSPKNVFGASTGFEPVASASVLQCSTDWAMKSSSLYLYVRSSHNSDISSWYSLKKKVISDKKKNACLKTMIRWNIDIVHYMIIWVRAEVILETSLSNPPILDLIACTRVMVVCVPFVFILPMLCVRLQLFQRNVTIKRLVQAKWLVRNARIACKEIFLKKWSISI